jgi:hypothetical protein
MSCNRSVHVGSLVDEVAMGRVFCVNIIFRCPCSTNSTIISNLAIDVM